MIKSLQIQNFKSFAEGPAVPLPRFMVLVGDNAAGKTNFCDALAFARDILDDGLEKAFLKERRGDFLQMVHQRDAARQMRFKFVFGDSANQWELTYEFRVGLLNKRGTPQITFENLSGRLDSQTGPDISYLTRDANQSLAYNNLSLKPDKQENWRDEPEFLQISRLIDPDRFPAILRVRNELHSLLVLRPDPEALRRSVTVRSDASLAENGFGLAAILDSADPHQINILAEILGEGDRLTRSIRTLAAEPGKKMLAIQENGNSEPYFPDQLSDGTLRLLALLSAILGIPKGVHTLVIEEPENGLHFSRLSRLVAACRERIQQDENAQIILTSHAIPLLHLLEREEVKAVVRGSKGESQIMEPPEEEKWLRFREEAGMTIGDLYTTGLWPKKSSTPILP